MIYFNDVTALRKYLFLLIVVYTLMLTYFKKYLY